MFCAEQALIGVYFALEVWRQEKANVHTPVKI